MTKFYNRTYKLQVSDFEVSALQVEFDVADSIEDEPKKATVRVSNLSEDHRKSLSSSLERPPVVLSAGYSGDNNIIFKGKCRPSSSRQGSDWVTTLECLDGIDQIQKNSVQISFGKGVSVGSVIKALVDATGLDPGDLVDRIKSEGASKGFDEFIKGFTALGNPDSLIKQISRSLGLKVSIRDETYTAIKQNGSTSIPVQKLSPSTGLVGSPEVGERGRITVRSLLLSSIQPGDRFSVDSQLLSGLYRVDRLRHSGSWRSGDWLTELTGRPI